VSQLPCSVPLPRKPQRRLAALLGCALVWLGCALTVACPGRLDEDLQASYDAGVALEQEGQLRKAAEALEFVRDRAPEHWPTRVALARVYADLGALDRADAEIDAALARDSDLPEALAARGHVLSVRGRADDARRVLEEAAARFPKSREVAAELGLLYASRGDAARALASFARTGSDGAGLPYAVLLSWAQALESAGRTPEAIAKYEAAVARAPERRAEAHAALGHMLLLSGTGAARTRGTALLEEALRRQPGEPEILRRAGTALLATGRIDEARNVLQRALHAAPDDASRGESAALLSAATQRTAVATAPAAAPNVVLVVIDTLRRDHVGAYGYSRDTTPTLDRLAREGVVVEDAISQAPWTAASIGTLFTGLYPSVHGVDGGVRWGVPRGAAGGTLRFAIQKALRADQMTLAEMLRRNGYATAGFVSNTYVNSIFGLAQGFEVYHDEHGDYSGQVGGKRRGADTNRLVFEWLASKPREPFFLFVHYNDPHLPYDPPAPYGRDWTAGYRGRLTPQRSGAAAERNGRPASDLTADDVAYLTGLYDGEIRYADDQVKALIERVRANRNKRPVLTIVTADHGEEFLDHGSMSHGYTLYDEQLRVPLIFHAPALLPKHRVAGAIGLIDVAPTVLALAGIGAALADAQGTDQSRPLRGMEQQSTPGWTYSEATYAEAQRALRRSAGLKLIVRPAERGDLLFDLGADPKEMAPLGAHPELDAVRQALAERAAANTALLEQLQQGKPAPEVVLDEETEERLRSLGYIR